MTRPVLFTGDIFRQQARGGITHYFQEVMKRLSRPSVARAGLHFCETLGGWKLPMNRGLRRAVGLPNAVLDAWVFARRGNAIVHPTYYRDPRSLPAAAPVVATVFDMPHERFPSLFKGARDPAQFKTSLCRRADHVICISQSTRSDAIEYMGLAPEKVSVALLSGRDWSKVLATPVPQVGERFLLWVGERHAYKNFDRTLSAFGACAAARQVHLLCAGGGPFRPHERREIEAMGARARIHQRTLTEGELRWAYEHAAALVYTSRGEGFGVPLIEAFELGCPVLASDIPALREVGGNEAVYVAPDDGEAIAAGIHQVLGESREPDSIARRHDRAAMFSWEQCAAQHEAVYREFDCV